MCKLYDKSQSEYELHARIIKMRSKYEPFITITIDGDSMYPDISHGDKVMFETRPTSYEENDIIAFIMDNVLVVHRIINKRRGKNGVSYYTIKGDNSPKIDSENFTEDDFVGIVVQIQKSL